MFADLFIEFFVRLVIKFARRLGSSGWLVHNAVVVFSELKTSWTGCLLVIIHYRYRNGENRIDGKFTQPFISRNYAEAYLLRYPGGSTFPVLISPGDSMRVVPAEGILTFHPIE